MAGRVSSHPLPSKRFPTVLHRGIRIECALSRTKKIKPLSYLLLSFLSISKLILMKRILLPILFILSLLCAGCTGPDDNGGGGGVVTPPPGPTHYWQEPPSGIETGIRESNRAIADAASALAAGNTSCLLPSMPEDLKKKMGGTLTISPERATRIAAALREAKAVETYPSIIFYETTFEGSDYSFYTLKEGDQWILYGF